jgi:hypothetical protein
MDVPISVARRKPPRITTKITIVRARFLGTPFLAISVTRGEIQAESKTAKKTKPRIEDAAFIPATIITILAPLMRMRLRGLIVTFLSFQMGRPLEVLFHTYHCSTSFVCNLYFKI